MAIQKVATYLRLMSRLRGRRWLLLFLIPITLRVMTGAAEAQTNFTKILANQASTISGTHAGYNSGSEIFINTHGPEISTISYVTLSDSGSEKQASNSLYKKYVSPDRWQVTTSEFIYEPPATYLFSYAPSEVITGAFVHSVRSHSPPTHSK